MNPYLGSGYVYFKAADWNSERYIAETENFDVAPSHETADRMDTNGGPLFTSDRQIVRTQTAVTFGSVDIDLQNLQLLFGAVGESGEVSATGSPFVSSGSEANGWHQFSGFPISCSVSSVTYAGEGSPVEGTHYELDATLGRIRTLQDGLGAVTVAYSVTGNVFGFAADAPEAVRGSLRLVGGNTSCGTPWHVYIADCVLTPSGTLSMKSRAEFSRVVWSVEVLNNSLTITGAEVPA